MVKEQERREERQLNKKYRVMKVMLVKSIVPKFLRYKIILTIPKATCNSMCKLYSATNNKIFSFVVK